MKLNQLRHVVAVAERGSLRAAARHLGLAQPALTRSIQEIERQLGVPLFERHARGVVLTAMGQLFLRRAGAITREVERAREEIEQAQGGVGGTVAAALSIVPHAALPHVLGPFGKRYPEARLRLIEGSYPMVESALMDGSIDFYMGASPGSGIAGGLALETLFENSRVVVGRSGHPLAHARSLRELVGADWMSTSVTHKAEEEFAALFKQHRLPAPKLMMQTQGMFSAVTALVASNLLAMVPVQWMEFALTRPVLQMIPIDEILAAPPIVLVRRAWVPLTPAAEHFCDLLKRAMNRSLARQPAGNRKRVAG
jgi:LysR family transcriptional regulator of abg operon